VKSERRNLGICAQPRRRSINHSSVDSQLSPSIAIMSQFRAAKKLDIGCYVNIRNIRDHTKRKVYNESEPERYAPLQLHIAQD
jgi:hypothetical protein